MLVPKLISSKSCFEYFYSKIGTQTELNDDDFRLWAAELTELIGFPLQYIPKIIGSNQNPDYDFDNYSVPLPCDFHKLIPGGISVNGYPVTWRQNAFHYLMDGDCCDLETINSTAINTFTDQFGNMFSPSAGEQTAQRNQNVTFDITDNRIVFNIKEGNVCMAYWSIPIDNEGYIMIPDTAKYKRAVTDYLIWCNDYILWRQDAISDKVYKVSEENKNWSIASASMELKIPDENQIPTMQNSIIRLVPLVRAYNNFYRDMGSQENLRFK